MPARFVVVDTEFGFVQRLQARIDQQDVAEKYSVAHVVPNASTTEASIVAGSVVGQVEALLQDGIGDVAVLVDIVVLEQKEPDSVGFEVAKRIRQKWPTLRVFLVTDKLASEKEEALFSAATLEDVDGVFVKSYLTGIHASARRYRSIFAIQPGGGKSVDRLRGLSATAVNAKAKFGDGLEWRTAAAVDALGGADFWTLVSQLFPDATGTVALYHQGRSGAVVFRVTAKRNASARTALRPKSWVLKVDRNPALLEREAKRYRELVASPMPRSSLPRLAQGGCAYAGELGGFAVELEQDAIPLREAVRGADANSLTRILGSLERALSGMYGDATMEYGRVWPRVKPRGEALARDVAAWLEALRVGECEAEKRRVYQFCATAWQSETAIVNAEGEIDVREIHGDLNSGNVLVTPEGDAVVIDLASSAVGPIVMDAAKLERDCLFRVQWAGMKVYHSWDEYVGWMELASRLARSGLDEDTDEVLVGLGGVPRECGRAVLFVRRMVKRLSPSAAVPLYRLAVLSHTLSAIVHPEFPLQRRMLATVYSARILERAEGG